MRGPARISRLDRGRRTQSDFAEHLRTWAELGFSVNVLGCQITTHIIRTLRWTRIFAVQLRIDVLLE